MFSILLVVVYFLRTIRNICYQLFWWEIKEYRFDRMFIHLRETDQGFRWIVNPIGNIKWIFLFVFLLTGITSDWGIALIYIIELKNGWKFPPLKPRVIAIALTVFVLLGLFILIIQPFLNLSVSFLIADKLLAFTITFLIFISNIFFNYYKKVKVNKAKIKVSGVNKLKVIGITGSYGKTTTKELTAQLLGTKYRVLKTLGSQNTDIGIAERILSSDLSKYDYFICEMAAYKRGEITQICKMLKGKIEIGVITGINEQHQSLFASLENTQRAKFELIEAINSGGVAIFNGKSKHIEKMISWAKAKNLKVIVDKTSISNLPTLTQNLSLAKNVTKAVGVAEDEIKRGIEKVQLPDKTMNITKKGNLYLIDNTFNSNPDGVYAALEYLRTFKGTKILVLQPLIELGKYTSEIHRKIGEKAAEICDFIIVTNKNFYDDLKRGVKNKKISHGNIPQITEGVILFQGKETEKFLKKI